MAKNNNRSGLGRGLNSLLGGSYEPVAPAIPSPSRERVVVDENGETTYNVSRETFETEKNEVESAETSPLPYRSHRKIDEVPLESVVPNPNQPRTNFKQDEIDELAASIEKDGLLQPILVRTIGENSYQIIAGERRWQACKKLGLKTVPVRIKDVDEDRALELALIENIQRSDLNPIEEAYGYKRMMERRNMTQSDVAQAMSKGRSTVANALRLLDLPEEAQQLLFEDKITAGHARAILSVPTKEGRETLANKLTEDKLSVREAENLAHLLSGKPSDGSRQREPIPPMYKSVAKALKDVLKTNVRVKSSKGKNKIEIEFNDEADLERLFEELLAYVS
ncbi:MAG: ParB/RepB/Spo0J family partition protein [Eggerthellaceae bacterium]|nr:ParB/RepB/Spo0J family partition protein [Eggerthellaceae bacterium]